MNDMEFHLFKFMEALSACNIEMKAVGKKIPVMVQVRCLRLVFSSRRRDTRFDCDWSSDVCSSDLVPMRMPKVWRMWLTTAAASMPGGVLMQDTVSDWMDLSGNISSRMASTPARKARPEIGRASCRERG